MRMRRARRLVSVAVVASLAVIGLSACRSTPSVAAYIGAGQIADTRAQAVYAEVHKAILDAGKPAPGELGPAEVTRADVVGVLVGAELLPEMAKEQGVSLPADAQIDKYASALRLPPNTEFTRLYVQESLYANQLMQKATGGPAPTEADLREVFNGFVEASGGDIGVTFDQFKGTLNDNGKKAVQEAVSLREEIRGAATKAQVRINPRYGEASVPVLMTPLQSGVFARLMNAPLVSAADAAPVSAAS
jgi:hypothetical protein